VILSLSVREFILKLTNEDYKIKYMKISRSTIRGVQDQVYDDFKSKYTRTPVFSLSKQ
jgi:hypothetical protein